MVLSASITFVAHDIVYYTILCIRHGSFNRELSITIFATNIKRSKNKEHMLVPLTEAEKQKQN